LGLRPLGLGGRAQTAEEQGLINPTVEDRDAQLDALGDYVPPFQSGLSRKLGGRQVIGHRSSSSFAAYMFNSMPCWLDGLNASAAFCLLCDVWFSEAGVYTRRRRSVG
jgi:hypothetical protein